MEKEIINNKIIVQDMIQNYRKDFVQLFLSLAVTTLTFVFLCLVELFKTDSLLLWVAVFLYFFIYSVIFIGIISRWIYISKMKKGDFKVEIDCLAEKPKTGDTWGRYEIRTGLLLASLSARGHRLRFARYGEFSLLHGSYYGFSPTFYMTDNGVYNCAKIGEDFYVVLIGKRKVPMNVYSTAFFTLQEEG